MKIMFSTPICVYKNSITAGVVVSLVPQQFTNTRELFDSNYTFIVADDDTS